MKKTRRIPDVGRAIEVDHLDGGTFGIVPMSFDDAQAWKTISTRTDFRRDTDGGIIYNKLSGAPQMKYLDVSSEEEIEFAVKLLRFVDGIEFAEGQPERLAAGDERIPNLLKLTGTSEVLVDDAGKEFIGEVGQRRASTIPQKDDKPIHPTAYARKNTRTGETEIVVPIEEPLYRWVIRESVSLTREVNELLRKNSLPTPS